MLQNSFSHLCCIIIVFLHTFESRRYEVEQEAQNLYSTNLRSVIEKFRRTPEYLKILNDQTYQIIRKNTEAIIESTIYYYANKLQEKVTQFFGGNETHNLRTLQHLQLNKILRKPRKKLRNTRQNEKNGNGLDDYKKFHSTLSLEQKNNMKELGFEFAGRAIHGMISSLLPDGALPPSTLLPDGGDTTETSSTIRHHDHEITQQTSPATEATESTSTFHTHTTDDLS